MIKLHKMYKHYSLALRVGDMDLAAMYARTYNRTLYSIGGAKKNPGEMYLRMGKIKILKAIKHPREAI